MQSKITSLPQLINKLNDVSKEEYKSIGVTLDIPLDEFLPYAQWSDDHYTRNCIVREKDFELILLCWEPGQSTAIHCHGGEECWVYIIDGHIEESHYQFLDDKLIVEDKVTLTTGDKSFMSDDLGYHRLDNNASRRSMSLHLYMEPIDVCTVYDNESQTFLPKSLSYHSHKKNLVTSEV